VRISSGAAEKLTLYLAISGVFSGLALAILIALTLWRGAHPIPWYDLSYFVLLILVGIYELGRFLLSFARRGRL
jgi:hypothetical protein